MKKIKLMIIRGLPGQGKSTLAKEISEKDGVAHFENDMYFMKNGKYEFDQRKAKDAADWCFNSVMKTLKDGKSCIVSNVFVSKKSIDRYVDAAKKLGAEVAVFRMTKQFKNVHEVPEDVFNSMKRYFCKYPGEILVP